VTIWGFIDGNDVLTIVPVNPGDNVLHLLLALVGFAAAALTRPGAAEPGGAVRR